MKNVRHRKATPPFRTSRTSLKLALRALFILACTVGIGGQVADTTTVHAKPVPSLLSVGSLRSGQADSLVGTKHKERVLFIGGSAAHGWDGPENGSYLVRAFSDLSAVGPTEYVIDDETFANNLDMPSELQPSATNPVNLVAHWIANDRPSVVVISWGLLNDMSHQTPLSAFTQAVHDEMLAALVAHAAVLLVTPPVVAANAEDHTGYEAYVQAEENAINGLPYANNVHVIHLNGDMAAYLAMHNQTWQNYYGDNWHPDAEGQALAGQLLFTELQQEFGTQPIRFDKTSSGKQDAPTSTGVASGSASLVVRGSSRSKGSSGSSDRQPPFYLI